MIAEILEKSFDKYINAPINSVSCKTPPAGLDEYTRRNSSRKNDKNFRP